MKKILLTSLSFILCLSLFAQDAQRAASTKVIDALNQLPADKEAVYNRIMDDLMSAGDQGVALLVEMLNKNDDSRVQVVYALSGLAAHATNPKFSPVELEEIRAAYTLGVRNAKTEEDKAFLSGLLYQMGGAPAPGTALAAAKSPETDLKTAIKNWKTAVKGNNIFEACTALDIIIRHKGSKAIKEVLKSIDLESSELTLSALNDFAPYADAESYSLIIKKMLSLSTNSKKDIIYWLGQQKDPSNLDAIIPYLGNSDFELVKVTARAVATIGGDKAVNAICQLLTSPYAKVSTLATDVLLTCPGDVSLAAQSVTEQTSINGKMAIMRIIAARKKLEYRSYVYQYLNDENELLRQCAYSCLRYLVEAKDLTNLCQMLEDAPDIYTDDVQEAIMASLDSDPDANFKTLKNQADKASPAKIALYWPMMARTGSKEAVSYLCNAYDNATEAQKAPAFNALCLCRGIAAAEVLLSPVFHGKDVIEKAIDAAIEMIAQANVPAVEKYLYLRLAMENSTITEQKRRIIDYLGKASCFPAVIYTGSFLEDPILRQNAAAALRKMAVGHPEYNSPELIALMKRVIEVYDGPEKEYELTAIEDYLKTLPSETGYVPMFNGKDMEGWQGLVGNPISRAKMNPRALAKAQKEADEREFASWQAKDGNIYFNGIGYNNLCTKKAYGDFEMYVEWKLYPESPEADAGIYLRGAPQVQIWDIARTNVGAEVGSGALYNNTKNPSKPICVADNTLGQWNAFYIRMVGERVTVYLNGVLVTDNIIMENYWDRSIPIFAEGPIELQAHESKTEFRNLYIREIPRVSPWQMPEEEQKEGFQMLFDGTSLHSWMGNTTDYVPDSEGNLAVHPSDQGFGDLYTSEQYGDFIFRFEFRLTPGANNGVGIRAPGHGDAAYEGMEIQVLDHYNSIYQPGLRDYQYHGSVYGIIPTQNRDALKPVGEWNVEEIYAKGSYIRVTLNGIVITEGDIKEATKDGTYDHREHPGLFREKGHIGFLGHGSELWFRHIRVKKLD